MKAGILRWIPGGAALAFAPKCAVCLLGYAGLGAMLGLSRPALCGAATPSPSPWRWLATPVLLLGWIALRSARAGRKPAGLIHADSRD